MVEDDLELRTLLAAALRRAGYQVIEASDGADLLGHLYAEVRGSRAPDEPAFDAVVTDVCMPGLTGLEALTCVRGDGMKLPIILMTAFGSPELHAMARKRGATAVLNKPFLPGDLRLLLGLLFQRSAPRKG